jgi:hypothetical protein
MDNLPALFPNATPLVEQIFRKNIIDVLLLTWKIIFFSFWQSLKTFTVIVNNNYPRISDKMGFTIEDEALIIIND